jgi:hypothetical protein
MARTGRSTPGALRLLLFALTALALAWGALAAVTVAQHAAAATQVVNSSEPLSLDAQQIYHSLADADVTISTGYLYGPQQPTADRVRYQDDIATVAADLRIATAASGAGSPIASSLAALDAGLPVYTGYVADSEVYNSQSLPAGGSYTAVASEEMHLVLLPAARAVYDQENSQLTGASATATGLPLAIIAIVAGLLAGYFGFRAQRWLAHRTQRRINQGLFVATVAGAAALAWLAVALLVGRGDLLQATQHGSGPAETLAQADIGALQARGDEALNLISHTGDSGFHADILAIQRQLTTQLSQASTASNTEQATLIGDAGRAAQVWFTADGRLHTLDDAYNYGAETSLAIGTGPGSTATAFANFEDYLGSAITADQGVFASNAAAAQDAFGGLEIGVIVLAVVMAAGCAWGLSRRLVEYR